MTTAASLQSLEEFKSALNIPDADISDDTRLQEALNDGYTQLVQELHRPLLPVLNLTRRFHAPVGSLLLVPDCQTIHQLTAYGLVLAEGTDYYRVLGREQISTWGLRRISATGDPLDWRPVVAAGGVPPSPSWQIVLLADWGLVPDQYPEDLVRLNTNLSAQIWKHREHRFATSDSDRGYLGVGQTPRGVLNDHAKTVIADHQRTPIVQIGGQW